jgi:type IV fimbrial biogenesis protein FimT
VRTESGFTLFELVVTVAVIAVMSAMAIPMFKNLINDHKLRNSVLDLFVVLQHARLYAVKEHANVVFTFDPDGNGETDGDYMAFVDNGTSRKTFWTREADERIIKKGNIPAGIELYEASFAGGTPRTRFNSMGFPNGLGGHVYLRNPQRKYLGIHVNLNGNPRIVKSKDGSKGSWQ